MPRILIVYHSQTGNTESMAEAVAEGVRAAAAECDLCKADEADVKLLPEYDGLILGTATYYGHPAAPLKAFVDATVQHHGSLAGKVGGAFASCGVLGGGVETAVRAMLDALLIHGMIIQGTASGGHYGPVSVGAPNEAALKECRKLGERVANLAQKLA